MKVAPRKRKTQLKPVIADYLAEIKRLKAQGISHAKIATRLGITKNKVSGIIFRAQKNGDGMDIETRVASVGMSYGKRENVISLPVFKPRPIVLWRGRPSKDERLKKLLESGKPGTCQWLEGEATERNFCGIPCRGPYCETHTRRAFVPWKSPSSQASSLSPLRGRRTS